VSVFLAVLWKDLVTEWRSRDRLVAMGVFALLVVVVLHLAAPAGPDPAARAHLPGLLWVAAVFAAVLGLNRAFALELENEALSALALAPADRGWIFLGKATASFLLLGIVLFATTVVFSLAFDLDFRPVAWRFSAVGALGCLGLCSIGTLFAAMAVRTTYREVMLPLLLLPLLVPVLLGAVRATSALLERGELPWPEVQLLIVTDGVFLIISFLGFEYVLDE
jgi:heme exporter protein B